MSQIPPQEFFDQHAEHCKMFSNANRLKLLDALRDGECSVSELTGQTDIPQPTVSQHLNWLREQEIVTRRKDGVKSFYSVTDERIFEAIDLIREMTRERMEQ